jgi:GTPase SAR1 family protein
VTTKTLETLQVLVALGATWDAMCDELVSSGKAGEEAPALRICMLLWSQEHADGLPFTEIPLEVIKRGASSTQAYIEELKKSADIVLRRKICLVGCGCAGKTSLVKSIISKKPQLAHVDDRTIGIDHFPLCFSELNTGSNDKVKTHEVTFWDFAGQDPYQVAHSLFFSPRTLYLVCIDLEAFTTAFLQASIMANVKKQEAQLMNEFIDRTVMRWIRMIIARQPDAEFEFIAMKEDLLAENQVTGKLFKDQLNAKLAEVETAVREMKYNEVKEGLESDPCGAKAVMAGDPKESSVLCVNCTSVESIQDARTKIEDLIIKSDRGFQMPDTYSRALAEIVRMREAAKHQDFAARISRVFAPVDSLPAELKIEPEVCHTILQTLHDLGDVLWYEDLGVDLFQNTVVLDPLLLIDFIRQIFNHKSTGQVLSHADLKAMPYWLALDDENQMEAMKKLLQMFLLVYPDNDNGVMEWDSDLIVPAFWQTKTPAAWLFLGDILRIHTTQTCEDEAVRVHWEYHFEFGLSPSLFDHLVVASVSPYVKFDAGPDWIMYKEEEIAACRIMVGRDPKSLHRTIHVEAVVAETASGEQVEKLWESFEQLCDAFVKVLRRNPGLKISSFALDDKETKINMKRLLRSRPKASSRKWMPPTNTWNWFVELMAEK